MDLGLSEKQEMLREFSRAFLEKECPEALVRDMEEDERGYSPGLWQKMAGQGWTGLIVPESYSGVGMTFMELVVLTEEIGRALVPGPFLTNCVATISLLEAANEAQKQKYLPDLAAGTKIWTIAVTEASARFDSGGVELTATKEDDGYRLNGKKLFVRDSQVADLMLVAARTGGSGEQGVSLFIVDTTAPGVTHTAISSIDSSKQNAVSFENVSVSAHALVGEEGKAWPAIATIADQAAILECAYLVGLSSMAFDITLNYTKERVQFRQPIAAFQAMQHKAADSATDLDTSRLITYKAAWAIAEAEPDADQQAHIAKAWVSEASRRVLANCQQMHGGIGFTKDYKIQLYFRRQKAAELAWGDADFHRDLIGQALGV